MDYYDSISAGYDELYGQEQRVKTARLSELLNPFITGKTKLLDIGCGTGISLLPWNCEKIGIEPAEEMVNIARKKGLDVVQCSAEKMPFPNETFDVIISVTAVHHLSPEGFKEIWRVAKDDSIVGCTILNSTLARVRPFLEKSFVITHEEIVRNDILLILKKKVHAINELV